MHAVQKRLQKNIKYRKSSRLSIFDSIRNLPSCDVPEPISESQKKVEHRRMQLEKWKEEKEKKKKDAAAQKKKPFVAGIAHPPLNYVPPPPPKPMPSTSGRVTRSQSSKANSQIKNSTATKITKVSQSFAPSNASFKPPELKNLAKIPTLAPIVQNAKNISPCVTLSRGKDNARKEMKKKIKEGLLDDDTSNMESVDYFRCQLDSEVKRITEMCDTWEKISQQAPLTELAMEALLGAVGQGRLLVSQKLAQFGSLVAACAKPEPGAALVTPADLHGFWDMVFMQVENVDMRFKKLEELRARNWVEEQPIIQKRKAPKIVKNNTKPAATSRLRDLIAAARKAKKEKEPSSLTEAGSGAAEENSKTFEAGFFCVRSPVKSPRAPATPTLLKAVLSNEAKKASASKNCASFAMLRASLIGKNVENSDMASEHLKTPINLTATPARSILKSTNVASSKRKSGKKSIKVVLFNDSDVESQETKEDSLAQSLEENEKLAEINIDSGLSSMDVDKEVEINKENVKRKSKLLRQNALDNRSPVLTRSRCKSMNTPLLDITENLEDRRRSRGRVKESNIEEKTNQTPKRSTRKKKNSVIDVNDIE
ncbi:unnamed protein product, partial [Iphiclides podalirius]